MQDVEWKDWTGALGAEPTPDLYVSHLCDIFDECKRTLRNDGVLFLNISDSYCGSGKAGKSTDYQRKHTEFGKPSTHIERFGMSGVVPEGMKPQDLMGIPWMTAFELRRRGWWLRQEIIWSKGNKVMPESVHNRCTRSHEQIFMLAKSNKYFYDIEATKERGTYPAGTRAAKGGQQRLGEPGVNARPAEYKVYDGMRNKRDVWTIKTVPWKPKGITGHYASYPPELPYWCILAGAPKKVCGVCKSPYDRVVEKSRPVERYDDGRTCSTTEQRLGRPTCPERGWQSIKIGEKFVPPCGHTDDTGRAVVLDPFAGTGTTGCMAELMGADAILVDTHEGYMKELYPQRMEFCRKWYDKFRKEQGRE